MRDISHRRMKICVLYRKVASFFYQIYSKERVEELGPHPTIDQRFVTGKHYQYWMDIPYGSIKHNASK